MAGKARQAPPGAPRLILDSGAVIALARRDQRVRAFVKRSLELGAEVLVPAVVLAETLRGTPRDARVNQVIQAIERLLPVDEQTGRLAGALLGRARTDATIDSLVVASAAMAGGGCVLTSDPDDLDGLASAVSSGVIQIEPV